MAVSCGFFNSIGGDRTYNATQFGTYLNGLITDGVFTTVGNRFAVRPGGDMKVVVGSGKGWFKSTWIYNDADVVYTIDPADSMLNRIDGVVIDINLTAEARVNSIIIVKGVVGTNPDKPVLVNEQAHKQYPIAWINVTAGLSEITQRNITSCISTKEMPVVEGMLELASETIEELNSKIDKDKADLVKTDSALQKQITDNYKELSEEIQTSGNGDMLRSVYDPDKNGIIDPAQGGTGQTTLQATRNAMGLGNTTGALPVANGGTGAGTIQNNGVVVGKGTSAVKGVASVSGALYSTGNNVEPKFGTLPIAQGGTGATTAAAARNAMGLGNTTGALPVANGGTGQTTLQATRNAMGLGNTTGALPVANGGTGGSSAATARANLGVPSVSELNNYATLSGAYFTGDIVTKGLFSLTDGSEYRDIRLGSLVNTKTLEISAPLRSHYGILELCSLTDNYSVVSRGQSFEVRNVMNTAYVTGYAASWATPSSRRYKENITDLSEDEAKKILDVDVVKFDYKEDSGVSTAKNQIGVIAEDVESKCPEVVIYKNNQVDAVDYSKFVPKLIKLVQMQEKRINELEKRLSEIQN